MDIQQVENFMKMVSRSEKETFPHKGKLKTGLDLGTAYIVLVVLDWWSWTKTTGLWPVRSRRPAC